MLPYRALWGMAALVGLLASARPAGAGSISFAGAGSSGTIVLPSGSVPWSVQPDTASPPQSSWGSPGLLKGITTWPAGNGAVTGFDITFTGLPTGVTINPNPLPTGPSGGDDSTRFSDTSQGFLLNRSISNAGNSVTFTAPAGKTMKAGDQFFVNVVFTGNAGPVTFAGHFTTAAADAPEPAGLTLLAVGTVGLVGGAWKRRRRAAVA